MDTKRLIEKYLGEADTEEHATDDVDWDAVKKAMKDAAKDIHGKVDMKKIDGMMKNLYKHKPADTENAIQIGIDMMRSGK